MDQGFIADAGASAGVAVDGTHVWWANGGGNAIGRADLDGQNAAKTFIALGAAPYGVASDGAHVFWASGCCVGRADVDGSGVNPSIVPEGKYGGGIAVDAWTTVARRPAALSFGSSSAVPRGTVSTVKRVTYLNTGEVPLRFNGFALSGPSATSYAVVSDTCQTPVAPGASCVARVRFAPTRAGVRRAVLTALTNTAADLTTSLSGRAGPLPGIRCRLLQRGRLSVVACTLTTAAFASRNAQLSQGGQLLAKARLGADASLVFKTPLPLDPGTYVVLIGTTKFTVVVPPAGS